MIAETNPRPLADKTARVVAAWRGFRDDDAAALLLYGYCGIVVGEREGAEREMIAGLDPASREAFELHALDGFTAEETAARTGLSSTAVRLRSRRACRLFRECQHPRGSALRETA